MKHPRHTIPTPPRVEKYSNMLEYVNSLSDGKERFVILSTKLSQRFPDMKASEIEEQLGYVFKLYQNNGWRIGRRWHGNTLVWAFD